MELTDTATIDDGYVAGEVLVEPAWLEERLGDPGLRVIEVDVGSTAYDAGHIDGAFLWNIYRDLKDGDYRLIDESAIERLIARSGISSSSTVVFYGYAPAMGFWLMKLVGHADARVLNSAREIWRDDGRPWSGVAPVPMPVPERERSAPALIRADVSRVRAAIDNPRCSIVDVRTLDEFRGERFWPSGALEEGGRAGHVPSAVHCPIEGLVDASGRFRAAAALREWFSSIDLAGDREVITYCTIGARACTAWFALTYLLGREGVRVYDGSWAEWGRTPSLPVARD